MTEEATSLPITPKNDIQKLIEMGFSAGRAQPGTLGQKTVAGVVAPATKEVLQKAGVPEPFAEFAGYGAGGYAGSKSPPIDIGKKTKPSGLTERQFENTKQPREVSESKIEKIRKNH